MSNENSKDRSENTQTQAHHSLKNCICAYRNCNASSSVRLFFQLGFSALFCHKCAKKLLTDRLATPEASLYEKGNYKDGVYDID